MSITTNSLKSLKFTNSELENILENFGDGSYPTYMQNVKEFSRLLNEFKYNGPITKKAIMRYLYPKKVEKQENIPLYGPEDLGSESLETPPEYFEEKIKQDEYYNDEIEKLEQLRNEIDEKIKELRNAENEVEGLMNIPASESEVQKSHEERYKNYFLESTQNLLDGEIDETLSEEGTKFIRKHKLQFIDNEEYPCILLSPPLDSEKFKKALKNVTYATNTIKKEDHDIYTNYYLNKCTGVDKVFDLLDKISKETIGTYKILCDCGFIIEDTNNVSYERTAPKEDEVERSIPFVIKNIKDMKTYKHYIYSFISEKMEATHKTSSHHFIAIHTFLFKVVKLNKTGIRFNVSGYTFLSKLKCIRHVADDKNLCVLNSFYGL
ncbi:hypothetical protein TVAGG3_0053450 [Trichomonas vaginalis G3]|uniref:hypothetical protein n=2 Tax=Trichomonas vaginalis (strain ATCC PRA-98 / G3) TaxID=412133 RepID=UPI0021E536DA|nr:hypothetical protein TVAGG3_0053450 [Trichomonas vaginalis G3]KAI5541463.1 hypothetical protein TVAGG3_0053450 [Trichomonas vaginalis G3]